MILSEPTWRTPAPSARRTAPPFGQAVESTLQGEALRVIRPSLRAPAQPVPSEAAGPCRYLLTVLAGRSYLRFCELADDHSVVIGRNPAFADFVIHHGEVSRSNTRVWSTSAGDLYVQDLRSTNGSRINGKTIGGDPERLSVGDLLEVGPVPVGVAWWSDEDSAGLRRLAALPEEGDRDPLTGLLTPSWLNDAAAAGTGGFVASGQPSAVLLVVDRLGALHAQHGAEVGDTVFQNVARAVLTRLVAPGAAIRVGYGEIFVVLPDGDADAGEAFGDQILAWLREHLWLQSGLDKVSITGSAAVRLAEEAPDAWIGRCRQAANAGRTESGRGRVYTAVS